uniref:NAD(P)/FAD-dependent oxidoreductase n=1 Tax=Roseihalotalea indica TaxID=2867963 RepID=A0AA49GI36_9BACT|nr:NAD(P)/FAD-dependent oxidoreductase [Tunicatimonas sp. TK19036]
MAFQPPSIIIIGSGMAGLSAGCYAQMNGLSSQIFEKNDRAGGVCTSWQREAYTINGCIHWLVGSSPANTFHKIWQELGAVGDQSFLDHDRFFTFENPDGHTFTLYHDPDRLRNHLL